jgi:anti-sigma-K factor RskA
VVHEQAAGFALDALDFEESSAFERHVALCLSCEDELERLQLAAVALAFAGELPPPRPELRRRVLAIEAVVLPFRRRALPFLSVAVVAAVCAAVGFGLHTWSEDRSPAGYARAYPLRGAQGALLVASGGEAVLIVRGLPRAPEGKAYDVWVVQRGRPMRAGVLRGSMVELSRAVPPGSRVEVTVEPAHGSRAPTGPFVFRAETA